MGQLGQLEWSCRTDSEFFTQKLYACVCAHKWRTTRVIKRVNLNSITIESLGHCNYIGGRGVVAMPGQERGHKRENETEWLHMGQLQLCIKGNG